MKKILIVYYTKNGSTKKMAEKISMGVKMINGVEPLLRTLPDIENFNKEQNLIYTKSFDTYQSKKKLLDQQIIIVENSNYKPGKVFELNKKFKLEDSNIEKN